MSKEPKKHDDNEDDGKKFDVNAAYKEIISMMEPRETIVKTLRRLGGNNRLTTAERWKLKKAGLSTDGGPSLKVTRLTELANQILTTDGNMDVYQETYEQISQIVSILIIIIIIKNPYIIKTTVLIIIYIIFGTSFNIELMEILTGS